MYLLGNGRLVTRDSMNPFLENGCVAIEGSLIQAVGTTEELKKQYPRAPFMDARGGVIMPGFINAHNHIYSAFARGLSIKGNNPSNFLEVLDQQWWTIDRNLLLKDSKASADATYLDCIENGVTTVFDHHASYGGIEGSLFALAESAKEFGVRTNLCYEVSDRDGQDKMKAAVKENVDFIRYADKDDTGMVKGMMGMHAPFTLSNETLAYCASEKPEGAGYHIHVAEGIDDLYDSLSKYNKRLMFRLHDMDILGEKTICGHCIYINEAEMELVKHTDTMIVHNPESNMGNAVGCPPVLKMFEKGILIGLGTDGYTNDMLESYKVANILHKHNACKPNVAWGEIPTMLFENNRAMAARFYDKPIGILAQGAYADVIVLDYDPLTPMTKDNLNSHLLFGCNGHNVTTTIINGIVKMERRNLVSIDKQAVLAHCREEATDLWTRINAGR